MTPLAKSVLWISLALWTRRASPRDGVGTRERAWSRDLSGDCLPNGARDPLGVKESRDLPTVMCSSGLGAESWVRNRGLTAWQSDYRGHGYLKQKVRGRKVEKGFLHLGSFPELLQRELVCRMGCSLSC